MFVMRSCAVSAIELRYIAHSAAHAHLKDATVEDALQNLACRNANRCRQSETIYRLDAYVALSV
jgi:hypothetical protein